MKKLLIVFVLAFVVGWALLITYVISRPTYNYNLLEAIDKIVAQKEKTRLDIGEVSDNLREVVTSDPDRAVICLVVSEAKRGFPGISPEDEKYILARAEWDSAEALKDLEVCMKKQTKKVMIESGYNPAKERYMDWYSNNTSTAILFCYLPKAKKLGRETDFVVWMLEGYRSGREPFWFSN